MRMLVSANTGNICILNRSFITSNYKANLLYNRRCWLESGHTTRGFQPIKLLKNLLKYAGYEGWARDEGFFVIVFTVFDLIRANGLF